MILDVKGRRAEAAQIGFVAAVALVDALRLLMSVPTFQCKWPNDVMADGVKLAGMLLEGEGKDWLVLGLGVDVAHAPPPDMIERPATSLAQLGYTDSAKEVLERFTICMAEWLMCWRLEGFAPIRAAWLDRAIGLGGPIMVRLENETSIGTFVDLKDDGALVMKDESGQDRLILAGDVFVGVTI
jgi:BirA family biotin operon repressor/biotin-[acetyl-CoA-carboxylase] ligase